MTTAASLLVVFLAVGLAVYAVLTVRRLDRELTLTRRKLSLLQRERDALWTIQSVERPLREELHDALIRPASNGHSVTPTRE